MAELRIDALPAVPYFWWTLAGRGHGVFCNSLIIRYHFRYSVEMQAFFGRVSTLHFITHWESAPPKIKRGCVPPARRGSSGKDSPNGAYRSEGPCRPAMFGWWIISVTDHANMALTKTKKMPNGTAANYDVTRQTESRLQDKSSRNRWVVYVVGTRSFDFRPSWQPQSDVTY